MKIKWLYYALLFGVLAMVLHTLLDSEPPWDSSRPSIYRHLRDNETATGLSEKGILLPDEEEYQKRHGSTPWAAGGLDSVQAFQDDRGEGGADTARTIEAAIRRVLSTSGRAATDDLYALILAEPSTIGFIDELLDRLWSDPPGAPTPFRDFAYWLATESPDRNAVKLGMALLRLINNPPTKELVTLGLHDEFTLYAIIALENTGGPPAILGMAKRVHGWGRVIAVQNLAKSQRWRVEEWLVREGFRNTIDIGLTALPCAVGGKMADQLRKYRDTEPHWRKDDGLLPGACEIMITLMLDGPMEGMEDYDKGAEVTELLLGLLDDAPADQETYLIYALETKRFLESSYLDWEYPVPYTPL